MKVKDAMHKGVDWVSPDTPITEIAKLMREHDIGCIPIGEDDKLIGMVTDRDIVCKGLAGNGFDVSRATARDVMTEGIHCCREDDDLGKAIRHMETLKVRRLPVINKSKRMVGMISLGDVSQFCVRRSGVRLRQERFGPSLKRRPVAIASSQTAHTCSTANGCGASCLKSLDHVGAADGTRGVNRAC